MGTRLVDDDRSWLRRARGNTNTLATQMLVVKARAEELGVPRGRPRVDFPEALAGADFESR